MKFRIALFGAACFMLTVAAPVYSQKTAKKEGDGLAVGKKAPDFQLKDHNGKQTKLQDMLKNGNVALVFYRSVEW